MIRLKRRYSQQDYLVGDRWTIGGKPMIVKWFYTLSKKWVVVCWEKTKG
jgi:hypothetical protein